MQKGIRIVSILAFIEGMAVFVWLASIPTGGGGFSPIRLISLSGILLVSLGGLVMFVRAKSENRFTGIFERITNSQAGILVSFLLIGISLSAWVILLNRDQLSVFVDEAVYIRFLPIAIFGILLCLQTGMVLLIPNTRKETWFGIFGPVWKPAVLLFGCFLILWGLMAVTGLGFIFDEVGLSWGPPGTPITFAQVNLVLAISLLLAFAYGIFESRIRLRRPFTMDALIFIGLWALAVILWWNQPVSATHFNPPPMEPNFETYPNSDALIFDRSSYHLLFGVGFSDQLIRRPLYVGMLTLFHAIGGLQYENTIFLQILILAFIPSLIYLLASLLSNRLAGLVAGGLILLREKNSIELSDRIVTANAKLMMSDMLAMLGVIAFIYLVVRVFSAKERSLWLMGIAGACLGLIALVRAQVFILVPLLLLFLLLEKRPLKIRLQEFFLIMLGMAAVMAPWVWRNWNLTGTFVLDDRGEEKLLARNYSPNPVGFPEFLPGETEKEYSARIKREILAYVFEHPTDVALFVSNHFFRNLATGAVYITPTYSTDSPHSLVDSTLFWDEWTGALPPQALAPLFVNLLLIALGIGIGRAKDPRTGWFPFITLLFYCAGNALVRTSGWRFSLPTDWIFLLYFSIGIAYLPSRVRFFSAGTHSANAHNQRPPRENKLVERVVFGLLILLGGSVPIAERLIPQKDLSGLATDARKILADQGILSSTDFDSFMQQENAVFYSGIALYPRHITPKSRIYLAYVPREYPSLHFWLINDGDHQIVLPLLESPVDFPHASKVSIIGCQENNYISAWAVIEHAPARKVIIQQPRSRLSCPSD